MRTRPAIVAALLAALALAGCATPEGPGADATPGLVATDTTGVLRGVVVDQAVRPVANATVTARGPEGRGLTMMSGVDGLFGFSGLAPGTWFVEVEKVAYSKVQVSVEVVAGVSAPAMTKLQVMFDPGAVPFSTTAKIEAFVQCIVPGANLCAIINLYPCALAGLCDPIVDDTSYVLYYDPLVAVQRTPDWFQAEMVWQSTQSVSTWLSIRASAHSPDDGAGLDERRNSTVGPSPLAISLDKANATEWETGTKEGVSYEIFAANEYTCDPIPTPAGSIGLCGGVVLNQQVAFYFNTFYGYLPPDGWMFSLEGTVPPPPT